MVLPYGLNRLTGRQGLIDFLGIDQDLFDKVINFVPTHTLADDGTPLSPTVLVLDDLPPFLRHTIPKRNAARGYRIVWEPYAPLKHYKALARRLDIFFGGFLEGYPHKHAFGYRPRRNIRENAAVHTGHKFLLSVDIRDFFPSISTSTIQELFERLSVAPEVANLLARFVTVDGALALGLPTSPVLSNAIALPIDHSLNQIAEKSGCAYSRYSDDISFSGEDTLPDIEAIAKVLVSNNFSIALEKTRSSKKGQAHFVTGLSVSDPVRPHVPRSRKRRLRQELHYAGKFGLEDHLHRAGLLEGVSFQSQVNRLDGMVKFTAFHEPNHAHDLKEQWRNILETSGAGPSFKPRDEQDRPFYFFIDEAEMLKGNQRFLALCMVATQRAQHIVDAAHEIHVKLVNDLWTDGDVGNLVSRGLHYAEATQDQRLKYIERLANLPVDAYVAYVPYEATNYDDTYIRLLSTMLPRRLISANGKFTVLTFEKNNKVSQNAVRDCVTKIHSRLETTNNRRPLAINVEFVAKPKIVPRSVV